MFQEASHPVSHQLLPENGWFQEKNVDVSKMRVCDRQRVHFVKSLGPIIISTNIHGKIFLRCYGGERQSAALGISEPLQTLVIIGLKKRKVIPLTLRAAWGGCTLPLDNFFL